MSYGPSLYRRHRPRTFADVVGQEHVVRTLRNAVERDKVHHAYLFVGSRGTGKTSMAKILAACLNCENGPTTEPCGACESCRAIAAATSLDVIEMDAASNNSVDDIRDLREKVAYAPVSGRHKIYILDEAHMLSSQAWNAFLKTLEEPPPRTIFVLATTEAQKVLPTVVDRCHRFDFGRPSVEQVARVLDRVAEQERIDVQPGALTLIARHATGSFRDALGTLEQLVTYAGERQIEAADVLAVLGVADSDLLFAAVGAVIARDPAQALRAAAKLAESGRDPGQVLRDLEVHGRELLTVQVLEDVPTELRVTPERDRRLVEQARTLSGTDAVRLLDLVSAAIEATANGAQARIQLELLLAKAAAPEIDPSVAALLARIERLEAGQATGVRAAAVVAAAPTRVAAVGPDAAPPRKAGAGGDDIPTVVPPTEPPAPPPPPATPPDPPPTGPDPTPPTGPEPTPPAPEPPPPGPPPGPTPQPGFAASPVAKGQTPAPAADAAGSARAITAVEASGSAPAATAAEAAGPRPAATAADAAGLPPGATAVTGQGGFTLEAAAAAWPAVVELVRAQNALVAAALAGTRPVAVSERDLTVAFPSGAEFLKRKAEQDEHRRVTADALRAATGHRLNLRYELGDAAPPVADTEPVMLSGEELVRRFLEEFDAEEILQDEHHEAEAKR